MSLRRVENSYQLLPGEDVTDEMLGKAAKLFNENYGIWGPRSDHPGKLSMRSLHPSFLTQDEGEAVKLRPRRLRAQYLPQGATVIYVMVTIDGELAGNAFACRWRSGDMNICWITQLVVGKNYRERGLAGGLLRLLRDDSIDSYGIMSSHPAACLAAAHAFGCTYRHYIRIAARCPHGHHTLPLLRSRLLTSFSHDRKSAYRIHSEKR